MTTPAAALFVLSNLAGACGVGTLDEGDRCGESGHITYGPCPAGLVCVAQDNDRVCARVARENEPCRSDLYGADPCQQRCRPEEPNCPLRLICAAGAADTTRLCRPFGTTPGDACDVDRHCAVPLVCNHGGARWTCQARAGANQPCGTDQECAQDLVCVGPYVRQEPAGDGVLELFAGRCTPRAREGAACDTTSDCVAGLTCSHGIHPSTCAPFIEGCSSSATKCLGTCVPPLEASAACDPANQLCREGLGCIRQHDAGGAISDYRCGCDPALPEDQCLGPGTQIVCGGWER